MAGESDSAVQDTCSPASAPGDTTQPCPALQKKVVSLQWDHEEVWCSDDTSLSGTTAHYLDGDGLTIEVKAHGESLADASAVKSLPAQVTSNGFGSPYSIVDILPAGGPSWNPRTEVDGETGGVKTVKPLSIRFIPNVARGTKEHKVKYQRTNPASGSTPAETVDVFIPTNFELEVTNYLLTIHGSLKYVRGWGREILELGDSTLTGGWTQWGSTKHWGKLDPATGNWKYWDGSAWQNPPASWVPDNSNHFGAPFYKSGSNWVYRDNSSLSYPDALGEWPDSQYKGAGNPTDTKLNLWKSQMDTTWSDQFDIKRKGCRSTKDECCRYKTRCETKWTEVETRSDHVIIIYYENYRSDATSWSMGDNRTGLAPHEFGHLLGAPDEYAGVFSTQLGVNDSDGLSNGVDANCVMGVNMTVVKKRHLKGICEMLALLVKDQFGKDYTYEALAKAANLASPPGTAVTADPGPTAVAGNGGLIGGIIGGILGAALGAVVGFFASGGNPVIAVAAAAGGALAGALLGAGLGSLF